MEQLQEQGFRQLQRAYNYLLNFRPVDISALRQITSCQRSLLSELRCQAAADGRDIHSPECGNPTVGGSDYCVEHLCE